MSSFLKTLWRSEHFRLECLGAIASTILIIAFWLAVQVSFLLGMSLAPVIFLLYSAVQLIFQEKMRVWGIPSQRIKLINAVREIFRILSAFAFALWLTTLF